MWVSIPQNPVMLCVLRKSGSVVTDGITPADLALPGDGRNRCRRIHLQPTMVGSGDLKLLLVAVRGAGNKNTTIRILPCPMPLKNVNNLGHFNDGGGERGQNSLERR